MIPEEEPSTSFRDSVALSWSGDQIFSLSPEQVKGLNKDDMVKIWKVQFLASTSQEASFFFSAYHDDCMGESYNDFTSLYTVTVSDGAIGAGVCSAAHNAC